MTLIHALPHVNLHAGKIALPKCFIVDSSVNDVVGLRHVRALDHPQVQRSDVRHRAGVLGGKALCQRSLPPLGERLPGQRGIGGSFGIHDSTVSGRRPLRPAEPGNVVKRCRHADEARDIAEWRITVRHTAQEPRDTAATRTSREQARHGPHGYQRTFHNMPHIPHQPRHAGHRNTHKTRDIAVMAYHCTPHRAAPHRNRRMATHL